MGALPRPLSLRRGLIAKPNPTRIKVYLLRLAGLLAAYVWQSQSTRRNRERAAADRAAVERLLGELGDRFAQVRVFMSTRPSVHLRGPVPTEADRELLYDRIQERLGPAAHERVSVEVTPQPVGPPATAPGGG